MLTNAERRKVLDDLVPLVGHAMQLSEAGDYEEARALLMDIQEKERVVGAESAMVWWQRAIAADSLKKWNEATYAISRAIYLDPFPAPFLNSGRIIRDGVVERALSYPIGDKRVGILCKMLIGRLEVLPNVHILYARHLLAIDKVEEAAAQVDAALSMDHKLLDGWMLRAAIARQRGDAVAVEEAERFAAEFEAHLLATGAPKAEA